MRYLRGHCLSSLLTGVGVGVRFQVRSPRFDSTHDQEHFSLQKPFLQASGSRLAGKWDDLDWTKVIEHRSDRGTEGAREFSERWDAFSGRKNVAASATAGSSEW